MLIFCLMHAQGMRLPTTMRVSEVLEKAQWPASWPYSPRDFSREDSSRDAAFYSMPRFCFHIDERSVAALTAYYAETLKEWSEPRILDLCASHVSHLPPEYRCTALGMNDMELKANPQAEAYVVHDLNENPRLPFEDDSFDVVTNAVSIDYLTQPLTICEEVARVLRPGGAALFALSNRCFPNKVIRLWLETNDLEHVFIVGSYFHYASKFQPPTAVEITPQPLWNGGTSLSETYLSVVRASI